MIVGVAMRLSNGKVHAIRRPARHCHLFAEYNQRTGTRFKGWPSAQIRGGEQGFITDRGVFLSREDAAAHAFECGQIDHLKAGLFSEDVW